jgi:hypothetical protein
MKRKLNLMNLNDEEEMARKEMKIVFAGSTSMCFNNTPCACGCQWLPYGGSGTVDNAIANNDLNLHSPGFSFDDCTIGTVMLD